MKIYDSHLWGYRFMYYLDNVINRILLLVEKFFQFIKDKTLVRDYLAYCRKVIVQNLIEIRTDCHCGFTTFVFDYCIHKLLILPFLTDYFFALSVVPSVPFEIV